MRHAAVVLAVVGLACAGCATPRYFDDVRLLRGPETVADAPDAGRVRELPMYDGTTGRALGWSDLLDAAAWADVVIIGEQHDDAVGHAFQAAVVADVCARWPRSALAMEMLERDEQALADDYREGIIDAAQLARLTHSANWGAKGMWDEWYQPVIDAACDAGATVVAANAPRRYVRLARLDGYDRLRALPPARRAWIALPGADHGAYRERFRAIMEAMRAPAEDAEESAADEDAAPDDEDGEAPADGDGTNSEAAGNDVHDAVETDEVPEVDEADETDDADEDETDGTDDGGDTDGVDDAEEDGTDGTDDSEDAADVHPELTDEEVDAIFRSQLVWDATMADSIARAKRGGARKVVHLVGQFHSDFDGGTVQEVRRRLAGGRVLVVSMQRAWPDGLRDDDRGRADVVVYTGERPPPDEESDEEPDVVEDGDDEPQGDAADDARPDEGDDAAADDAPDDVTDDADLDALGVDDEPTVPGVGADDGGTDERADDVEDPRPAATTRPA